MFSWALRITAGLFIISHWGEDGGAIANGKLYE